MEILFGVSVLWIGYIYIGYPCCLWLLGLVHRFTPRMQDDFLPRVSVLISARNEERDIGWKVVETLSWDYPPNRLELLVASDASEDRTDEILQCLREPRLISARMNERVGKNEALNWLSKLATGDLLFFTDANSHIDRGCLRRMVRYFADPRVGCVTGAERSTNEDQKVAVVSGVGTYLGYESWIKRLESKLGSVLVCDGSIFCIRRELYTQLQPDLANDFELPVKAGSQGYALLYEPGAWSFEKATNSFPEEFHRKRRICAQGALGFWRLRKGLRGLRAWQFVSRKLLCWLALIPFALLLASSAWLASSPVFRFALMLQLVFYAVALAGWWLSSRGQLARRLVGLPFYFLLIDVAALTGVVESCFGQRFDVWEIASHSRGHETTTAEVGRQ